MERLQDGDDVRLHPRAHCPRSPTMFDPERDIEFALGPIDSLDHSSRLPNYGSKMGIDATRKWPSEGFTRPWPEELRMDPEIVARVTGRWKEILG